MWKHERGFIYCYDDIKGILQSNSKPEINYIAQLMSSNPVDTFVKNKHFLLIYPLIFILGAVINLVCPQKAIQNLIGKHYLLKSNNIVNVIFAYNGNTIFLVLFSLVAVAKILYLKYQSSVEYLPVQNDIRSTSLERSRLKTQLALREYAIKLTLKYAVLYVLFFFIDHVFLWTGGSCSTDSTVTDALFCRKIGGKWDGGFDISGHFCFITNISLVLWFEIFEFPYSSSFWKNYKIGALIPVLVTWSFILTVTSIFYHTFLEKLLGCALGFACPYFMYYLAKGYLY